MITFYVSRQEGLGANILAQVITVSWLPCYTSLFSLKLKGAEREGEMWRRENICFHLSFWLCLKRNLKGMGLFTMM